MTPERFQKKEFLDAIHNVKIPLLAVDEAHCISEWGHDFRPDYSRIAEFRKTLGNPTTLALTATATPDVQKDIIKQLGFGDQEIETVSSGIERPNLVFSSLEVHGLDEKIRSFVALRHQHPGSMVVYFSLISNLEKFSQSIDKLGIKHVVYHGDLKDRDRRKYQEWFLEGHADLILATPAFGLGVDKKNVRSVIHAEIPGSIESYYQEAGRSGRDGNDAHCYLFYDQDDVSIQMDFIKWGNPDPDFIKGVYNLIDRNRARWKAEGFHFLRGQMNYYNSRDYRVETSVNLLKRWGSLEGDDRNLIPVKSPEGEWLDQKHFDLSYKMDQKRLLSMVQYAGAKDCRREFIYNYFGHSHGPCGHCDNCR